MIAETIPQLKQLSPDQKLVLAGELWDEVAADTKDWEPDPEFVEGLQQQLEEYRRNPQNVLTWEQVKANVIGRK